MALFRSMKEIQFMMIDIGKHERNLLTTIIEKRIIGVDKSSLGNTSGEFFRISGKVRL